MIWIILIKHGVNYASTQPKPQQIQTQNYNIAFWSERSSM